MFNVINKAYFSRGALINVKYYRLSTKYIKN
jgi:hypothetical protein